MFWLRVCHNLLTLAFALLQWHCSSTPTPLSFLSRVSFLFYFVLQRQQTHFDTIVVSILRKRVSKDKRWDNFFKPWWDNLCVCNKQRWKGRSRASSGCHIFDLKLTCLVCLLASYHCHTQLIKIRGVNC